MFLQESEDLLLARGVTRSAVEAAIRDPRKGTYFLVEVVTVATAEALENARNVVLGQERRATCVHDHIASS